MISPIKLGFVIGVLSAGSVMAADGAGTVQRDVNQQSRIEQGLKSGELNTREAAKLEKEEAHVDHMQAKDLKDGSLSSAEKAKLNAAQNKVSRDIYREKHDAQVGNPNSASSKRMQADVQRNVIYPSGFTVDVSADIVSAMVEQILGDLIRRARALGVATPLFDLATLALRVHQRRVHQ